MPLYITHCAFGIFILDENDQVILKHLTYPDVETTVEYLDAVSQNVPIPELKEIIGQTGSEEIVADNRSLARLISQLSSIPVRYDSRPTQTKMFRSTIETYLIKDKIIERPEEAQHFLREVAISLAKRTIISASEERDILVKQAIDAIDEIDKTLNALSMKLKEWYSLHHPSLSKIVDDNETYAKIVSLGGKQRISEEALRSAGLSPILAQKILTDMENDAGAEFTPSDLGTMKGLAKRIVGLYEFRHDLEDYVTSLMQVVAPNISSLVRPMVGARLISMAGSLRELARKPSSTIQVFGAERALFRSLKTGADPPKHGVIYQSPEVHTAPYWQRGKIARALASALSIASRIDAYSDRDLGDYLREKLERRILEIKQQNPDAPPPKQKSKPRRPQRKGAKRKRRGGRRR